MTWRWRRMSRQRPAATAATAADAASAPQGQVGLRQGRGLHLGHQHLFPREHVPFQEKLKKTHFFVKFVIECLKNFKSIHSLCVRETSCSQHWRSRTKQDKNSSSKQSVTFLVSKPKCQSQECDIFGFDTGFETKMSFSGSNVFKTCSNVFKCV